MCRRNEINQILSHGIQTAMNTPLVIIMVQLALGSQEHEVIFKNNYPHFVAFTPR